MDKGTKTDIKVFSLKALFAVISFILALYLFAELTDEIIIEKKETFDHEVFQYLSVHLNDRLIAIMRFFTFFGKPEFMIPAYILLISYFAVRRKKEFAWEVAIMGVSSTALLFGLKKLFGRNRPDMPILSNINGYSFPSGHALLTFVFCSVLVYLIWKSKLSDAWKWFISIMLILFSIIVGISRIVLRVHYPTDVIAGFALGYIWVLLGLWVQHTYITRKKLRTI